MSLRSNDRQITVGWVEWYAAGETRERIKAKPNKISLLRMKNNLKYSFRKIV